MAEDTRGKKLEKLMKDLERQLQSTNEFEKLNADSGLGNTFSGGDLSGKKRNSITQNAQQNQKNENQKQSMIQTTTGKALRLAIGARKQAESATHSMYGRLRGNRASAPLFRF
jgi:hypothetical protein